MDSEWTKRLRSAGGAPGFRLRRQQPPALPDLDETFELAHRVAADPAFGTIFAFDQLRGDGERAVVICGVAFADAAQRP